MDLMRNLIEFEIGDLFFCSSKFTFTQLCFIHVLTTDCKPYTKFDWSTESSDHSECSIWYKTWIDEE